MTINNKFYQKNTKNNLHKSRFKSGQLATINGKKYELQVYNILKKTYLHNYKFNTQKTNELGGCSSKNDLECNLGNHQNIVGIEIKKCKTPDWMQCSIQKKNKYWSGNKNCKIPVKAQLIFNKILRQKKLFNNKYPHFINQKITYDQLKKIKKKQNWKDQYFNIPNDTIKNIYKEKGCYYIQVSDYGLFHLGNDICNFKVPEFIIDQKLRIRIKIHQRYNRNGFCTSSIMASCQPKDIKKLPRSKYSLDNIKNLPKNLHFNKYFKY